jgi:hypothetical protein
METTHAITRFGTVYAEKPPCSCLNRFLNPFSQTEQGGIKMLRKDFIICKARNKLSEFIQTISEQLDKPRKKFLRQVIGAILLSGSLVVTEMARWIRDECSDRFYQLKRLLNHLVSSEGDLSQAVNSYRQFMSRYIQYDSPILIDITDIAKPRARRMKYLAMVRDGSEDKLVPGYWCVEVYAHLKGKRVVPLAMDVFSIEDPAVNSQNLQIDMTIKVVNEAISNKGVWVGDRGFDALNIYETWFSQKCNFVVRQRGDRCVITTSNVCILERDLVERLHQNNTQCDIVWTKVHLPNNNKPLYLVASWQQGNDEPFILMTTLVVDNIQQAKQVLWYYGQRWTCEEAGQFLKSRVGLERFRIRRYEAIQRLAILAMFAMGFLTWVLIISRQMTSWLLSLTSRFRKHVLFIYYRLLDGLQEFGRLRYPFRDNLLPKPIENG